eukprot:g6424.t1
MNAKIIAPTPIVSGVSKIVETSPPVITSSSQHVFFTPVNIPEKTAVVGSANTSHETSTRDSVSFASVPETPSDMSGFVSEKSLRSNSSPKSVSFGDVTIYQMERALDFDEQGTPQLRLGSNEAAPPQRRRLESFDEEREAVRSTPGKLRRVPVDYRPVLASLPTSPLLPNLFMKERYKRNERTTDKRVENEACKRKKREKRGSRINAAYDTHFSDAFRKLSLVTVERGGCCRRSRRSVNCSSSKENCDVEINENRISRIKSRNLESLQNKNDSSVAKTSRDSACSSNENQNINIIKEESGRREKLRDSRVTPKKAIHWLLMPDGKLYPDLDLSKCTSAVRFSDGRRLVTTRTGSKYVLGKLHPAVRQQFKQRGLHFDSAWPLIHTKELMECSAAAVEQYRSPTLNDSSIERKHEYINDQIDFGDSTFGKKKKKQKLLSSANINISRRRRSYRDHSSQNTIEKVSVDSVKSCANVENNNLHQTLFSKTSVAAGGKRGRGVSKLLGKKEPSTLEKLKSKKRIYSSTASMRLSRRLTFPPDEFDESEKYCTDKGSEKADDDFVNLCAQDKRRTTF